MSNEAESNFITDRQMAILGATRDIVCATVSKPGAYDVLALIGDVHARVTALVDGGSANPAAKVVGVTPAEARRSITPNGLVSFIDGKTYQTLKRHLTANGLDLHTYRERYGLPKDYPSVAANYAARRSELAKSIGLGQLRSRASEAAASEEEPTEEPKRRGRPRKAA